MKKLDRLVWAEGMCFESYGLKIGLRTSQPGVMDWLVPFFPPKWAPIEPPRKLDALFSWVVGGERRPNVRAFGLMYEGAVRISRTMEPEQLFAEFEANLRMVLARLSRRFVFIHAGVVGWRGYGILLPGRTSAGKSTLVEALVRAGAEYLCDEYAVVDSSGRVHPFAKAISIKPQEGSKPGRLYVGDFGGKTAKNAMKVGVILATRYRAGAKSRFREASPGQGMLDLIRNSFAARWAPSRVLKATRKASTNAIVLRGTRGEATEAAERLLEIVEYRLNTKSNGQGGIANGMAERFVEA